MTYLAALNTIQVLLLAVVVLYCAREWRSASRYRPEAIALQEDRFLAEYVALKRGRRGPVVAPVGAGQQRNGHEREQDSVFEFEGVGHADRLPVGSDA